MRMISARCLCALSSAALLTSCSTLDVRSGAEGGQVVDYRFGLTRVVRSADSGAVRAWKDDTLGVWLNGANNGFGWRQTATAAVPLDCRVAFFVDSQERMAATEKLVAMLKQNGERACASLF